MSRKRLTSWVLLLAVGMTARITVAAPRVAVAELKAIACCLEHCPKMPRRPMKPHCCCFVDSAANDPAAAATAPTAKVSPDVALGLLPVTSAAFTTAAELQVADTACCRAGPPLFLRIRSLRL